MAQVREWLNLRAPDLAEPVIVPGADIARFPIQYWRVQARAHGAGAARRDGARAAARLPRLQSQGQLRHRYEHLVTEEMTPQIRGTRFEELWRDLLSFHGWHPRKIRIGGEDNDFTALYNGLHVLGETRWFTDPMNGGKMREFLAKLDTRHQIIGRFVSRSGYDQGAQSVIRRSIATKTVVHSAGPT